MMTNCLKVSKSSSRRKITKMRNLQLKKERKNKHQRKKVSLTLQSNDLNEIVTLTFLFLAEEVEKSKKEKEEKSEKKEDDKEKKESKSGFNFRDSIYNFLFDNNQSPKPEGWAALLGTAAATYYIANYKKPMKELLYMDFLNNYLLKN